MTPTNELRIVKKVVSIREVKTHCGTIVTEGFKETLQQKWKDNTFFTEGEWRDVPVVEEETK